MKSAPKATPKKAAKAPRGRPKKAPEAGAGNLRIARRERRRERNREEIVDGARRVLLRDGLAATTLASVAKEVGLTKAALYYYFPSKEALLFEIIYATVQSQSRAVHDAVTEAKDGGEALGAIIRATVRSYASNLDDFRLAFLHAQVAGAGTVQVAGEQLARLHALNDVAFADATRLLSESWKQGRGRARVEPRMMAFLANVAALGLLTLKGMVESVGDPLLYSDEQLTEALARIFAAAAAP